MPSMSNQENTRVSDFVKLENTMEEFSEIYASFTDEGMRLPTIQRAAAGFASHLLSFHQFPQTLGDSIVSIHAWVRSNTMTMARSIGLENQDLIEELIMEVTSYVVGDILKVNNMLDRFDDKAYEKHVLTSLSAFITEKANDQTQRVQNQEHYSWKNESQGVLGSSQGTAGSVSQATDGTEKRGGWGAFVSLFKGRKQN